MKYVSVILILIGACSVTFTLSEISQTQEAYSQDVQKKDRLVQISLHQTITFEDLGLTFTGIEDSRCPLDVTCIWEGNALVTLKNYEREFTLKTDRTNATNVGPYEINLVDVYPYPTTMKGIYEEYIITLSISKTNKEVFLAPLKQIDSGVTLNEIKCNEEKHIAYKQNRIMAACVYEKTLEKLLDRDWALSKIEQEEDTLSNAEKISQTNQDKDAILKITPKIIDGEKYLFFEGASWNYFHEVKITMAKNLEKITSIKTKTDEKGKFSFLWKVPNNLQSSNYDIHVTDGKIKKEVETTIIGILPDKTNSINTGLDVKVEGEKQVRRGTTHNIEVHVYRDSIPVEGARVFLTIEDYGEDIIREFRGHTNQEGYFVYSWEIPKTFDDIQTLLAFVGVTDGNSSITELFKFHVYCLPGEKGCKVDGN